LIRPLLTAESSVINIVTTATGCVVPDTASIILTPDQCAGSIRAVKIGASASFGVDVSPNPASEQVHGTWSSGAIGEHSLQIISVVGEIVAEHRFTRTVESPTAGSVMLDLVYLAHGGYTLVFFRPDQSLSLQLNKIQ